MGNHFYILSMCIQPHKQTQTYILPLKIRKCFYKAHGISAYIYRASLAAQLVKNLPTMQGPGFDPWVGKIPWRRERLPTPLFQPREFEDCIFHGLAKSWTQLRDFHSLTQDMYNLLLINTQVCFFWRGVKSYIRNSVNYGSPQDFCENILNSQGGKFVGQK